MIAIFHALLHIKRSNNNNKYKRPSFSVASSYTAYTQNIPDTRTVAYTKHRCNEDEMEKNACKMCDCARLSVAYASYKSSSCKFSVNLSKGSSNKKNANTFISYARCIQHDAV